MPPTSAAMELKVLINILTQGQALPNLLAQTKQLTAALTALQTQTGKIPPGPTIPPGAIPPKKQVDETAAALKNLDAIASKLVTTVRFLAGGFLALESIRFLKDLADTAARAQVLATVLHVVGRNAGYSVEKLDEADRKIQSLGITATASRQALTQFIQAGLDLAKAGELARAAQDAAVILGTNSSVAFERLVTAVQTSNTLMLRHMGIVIIADSAYQKYAVSIGKTVSQLTTAERAQAFLNATLEKTKSIQGSYVAAMGDVGKQLSSLDRLTEDLKRTLGNNLLPAYLAIVEELTLFLQKMELVADEIYGQGEGAKKLGDDVRMLARAFFQAVEFLVEYRKEIGFLIVNWALITKVIAPLIRLLAYLNVALVGTGEGVLARLIARLGFLRLGLAGVVIIFLELATVSDRFNAALQSLTGAFAMLAEAVDLVIYLVTGALLAAVKMFFAYMVNPLDPALWLKPWKDYAAGVVGQLNYIANIWDLTKEKFKEAIGMGVTPTTVPGDARRQRLEEEGAILSEIMEKTREYNKLKAGGTAEQLTNTKKELDDLKKKAEEMTQARKKEQDDLQMNPAMRDQQEADLKKIIALKEEEKVLQSLDKAREKSKFWYTGGEISKPFLEQMSQFNDILAVFNRNGNSAKITVDELGRSFIEATGIAKTKADLEGARKALKDLTDSPEFKKLTAPEQRGLLARARAGVRTAELNVDQETRRETAEIERIREQHFREMEKRRSDHLSNEMAIMKSAFDIQDAMDQQAYTQRGMDLDRFYDRKLARLKEETGQELIEARNNLAALRREQEQNIPKTTPEREALAGKILAAEAALNLLEGETGTIAARLIKLELDREDARAAKVSKSKQTILDIAAAYGELDATLAAIKFKYDEQLKTANTKEERDAIAAERTQANLDAEAKGRQRLLDIGLIEIRRQQEALDLDQARLDAARKHIAALEKTGAISGYEAMVQRNALLRLQIAKDEQVVRTKTVELQKLQTALVEEESKIREEMAGKFSEETIALRIQTDLEGRRKAIAGLTTDIQKLNQGIADSGAELEKYSQKIQENFVTAFSDALTQTLTDFRKAGEAWVSLSTSIANQIVNVFVRAFTERLFNKLGLFRFIDRAMDVIFGSGGGGGGVTFTGFGDVSKFIPVRVAEGGVVSGPGTGTSDSVPAMLSAGEHVMPASKASQFMPLLEGIRSGKILPFSSGGVVQSVALGSVIPRRYAAGGMVVADGGVSAVKTGGGAGNMVVSLHPDALNMTMREWLEHEVVRQQGRR